MHWRVSWLVLIGCWALGSSGCSAARWVQSGPHGGVVAVPSNTNSWPSYHRDKALALIKQKCPGGYEIVNEEEVVTGQVAHTTSQTDTTPPPSFVVGGGSGKTTSQGGTTRSSDSFGGFAIPLGETQQQTVQSTTYRDVKEWRITYRTR